MKHMKNLEKSNEHIKSLVESNEHFVMKLRTTSPYKPRSCIYK